MATHKKAAVRVRSVRGLLRSPKAWCKHSYAKNANGCDTPAQSKDAVTFCLAGALDRIYGSMYSRKKDSAYDRLCKYLKRHYGTGIVGFNDRSSTTHAKVLKVCRAVKI